MPKKLLVYGAHVAEELSDAKGFGWDLGESKHDWATLVKNKVCGLKCALAAVVKGDHRPLLCILQGLIVF